MVCGTTHHECEFCSQILVIVLCSLLVGCQASYYLVMSIHFYLNMHFLLHITRFSVVVPGYTQTIATSVSGCLLKVWVDHTHQILQSQFHMFCWPCLVDEPRHCIAHCSILGKSWTCSRDVALANMLCPIICSSSHAFQTHHCVSITQLFFWDCNSVYRNILSNLDLEILFSFVFSSWGSTFVVVHLVAVAQLQFAGFGSLLDIRMRCNWCNLFLTKCATTFLAVMTCTHLTCQHS